MAMSDATERFPEAELVLDDELVYDEAPRRSTMQRRSHEPTQLVREGDVLAGKYRVERIPGRSGLGLLVQVRHLELGQEVTLKFLLPDACAYPEFVQRFVREARAAVKIQGEHVARVTDVGRLESGAPYMVREFLRGPDLAEVLKVRGQLPIEEAVDYVIQACEGVAEGHALGVIHRNLRPTSLVVTRRSDGTPLVKVFDFAAAESLHVDPFTERSVSLVGTSAIMASLPYLSPEQIRDPSDVDVRADVYALGAILHELLSGAPIYAADSAPALLAQVAADIAPSVRQLRPDIPGELDYVILRCLSKNRAVRYSSIAELSQALQPFGSEEAVSSVERVVRLAKRSRPPVLAAGRTPSVRPVAAPPATPFAPSPSAVPAARGPTGTLVLGEEQTRAPSGSGHDDVTTISPYAGLADPAKAAAAPGAAPERDAANYTPQPPPLRTSLPPPLRSPASPPAPATNATRARASASASPLPTPLPPPARSSMSGVSRSWAAPDEPAKPLFTRNRLIALGAVSALAVLGGALALRTTAASAPIAATQPPALTPAPVAAPPAPPPSPEPVASASAAASSAVPDASIAAAPPQAAPAAPVPVPAPPPVAPARAAAAAPAVVRLAPAPRPEAKAAGADAPAKAPPLTEKVARAKSAPGPDLFGDTD